MKLCNADSAQSWTLAADGLMLVAGAIDRELVESLGETLDRAYERIEQPTTDLEKRISAGSAAWGGIAIDHVSTLAPDSARCAALLDQVISRLTAEVSRCSHLGATFERSLSYIRRHRNSATFAPWHLDAYAAGTLHRDPVFNAWMPLTPVGTERPSLEFIRGAHRKTRGGDYAHQESGHPADAGYPTPEWIRQSAEGGNHVCLDMEPGDVVIFDHWTPHRTQVAKFGPYVRTSAEMRFHAE